MGSSSSKADGASWHDTVRQNASNLETSAQRTSETVGMATRAGQATVGHYGQAAVNTAAALHETSQQLQGSASQAGTHLTSIAGEYSPPETVYDAEVEAAAPPTTGGSCCGIVIGGGFFNGGAARASEDAAADLKSYRYSKASAAKDRFIRGLARAMKAAGIKVDPEAEPEEIIRELQKNLPHPKKGNSFSENGDAQTKICRLVAEKMNAEFAPSGDKIFDTTMSPKAICLQLTDLIGSLAVGLNSEYLEVHASLTRNLRNLEILETILQNAHARIMEDAKRGDYTGNEKAREDLADVDFYYQRAEEMRQRQVRLIENTLAVVLGDRKDELALALDENSDVHETVKKLGDLPGGKRTADTIAQVLYGTATVASVADKVDKALKETGLKVQEYLEAADTKAMKDRLFKLQQSRPDIDLGEFLRAQTILVDNFWRREELDSALRTRGEARGGARGRKRGGEYRSALDKRVEKQKTERRLIVRQFIGRMTGHYDDFLKAVNSLGPHIGKEIPLSDRLANLRDEFDALAKYATGRAGVELNLALIGYLRDISARQEKERFLSTMTTMVRIIDDVAELDMYRGAREYFARLRTPIAEMISTINYFTEQIQKKFGGDGDADADGGAEDVADVVKDIDHDAAQVGRSAYDLATATAAFKYYYYVARVRENLRQSSAEIAAYGDKYKDVLGDAVAGRLRQLKAERDSRISALASTDAKKWLDNEYAVKEQFYRALQAIDLQLHSFTDGIARHPEAVSDISRILEGVQAIARWYVEATGDNIAQAFDRMPKVDGTAVLNSFGTPAPAGIATPAHYYESAEVVNGNVGVPQMFQSFDGAEKAESFVKKALKEFQALRQIINAFVRIGDKFGGKSVWRDGMIMGPSKIVDALTDYLRQSAFSVGSSSVDPANGARDAPEFAFGRAGGVVVVKSAVAAAGVSADSGVYFASCGRGTALAGTFQTENAYFVMAIKAMIAKVLTVLGVFDMFERPGPIAGLTQTRIILGGGPEEAAQPEAAELYFRLVRLAEFYKHLFNFKSGEKMQISMMPDIEGVFSGLIRLVFQKVVDPAAGDYSDTEIRALIGECNLIYRHFHAKDSANAVQAALAAFVAEINRRYGAIRSEDWKAFQNILNLQRRGASGLYKFDTSGNPTSFAILPDEDDDEPYDGRAPSDRFMSLGQVPGTAADAAAASRYDLDTVDEGGRRALQEGTAGAVDKSFGQLHMLREFRQKIEALFAGASAVPAQYGTMIRQAATEMERAGSPDARFAVASRLILGSGALSAVDSVKILMFEETVGLGLDLLEMTVRVLTNYRTAIASTNLRVLRTCAGAGPLAEYKKLTGVDLADKLLVSNAYPNPAAWDASVNYELALDVVFDTVFGLATDFQNLVQVRFPNSPKSQLFLDFGKLRALIEELFADTGYYLDTFRTQLPRESLKPFEDRIRDLDAQLEDLIRGPPSLPEEEGREQDKPGTLEWMSRTLNSTFVLLTNPKWPVGEYFARKVFYDVSDGAFVKGTNTTLQAEQGKGSVVARVLSGTSRPKTAKAVSADFWFKSYDDIAGNGIEGPNTGVMFQFNTLVAKFIRSGLDVATNKIYRGLIDSFANGAFSRAVMQPGNAYPDLSTVTFNGFGVRGDPKNGAVLAESLALALRALVTKYDPRTQMSIHLTATLSEVPLYIKEGFRANLPVYANLFGLLHKKGELIKQMIGLTQLNLARVNAPAAVVTPIGGVNFLEGAEAATFSDVDTGNRLGAELTKQTLIEVIDSVSSGCYTLGGSISEVLRELADTSPVYLETQENSISRYRSSNGTLPIMPLSLCAWPLKIDQPKVLSVELVPEYTSGDARFKFMYGTRKLLGHPTASVSLADMPGAEQILQKYNGTAENRDKLTTERYAKFAENAVSIIRYLVGFRHYRAAMGISEDRREALVDAVAPGAAPTKSHVYALTAGSSQEVISIVEGSYQEEIVQRLTKVFAVGTAAPTGRATLGGRRQDEWRDNIIDMNIIPINVHALMRGIPLAPLYNYAYTFDEMVCAVLGQKFRDGMGVMLNAQTLATGPRTAVDAFLALLTDPYAPVSDDVYGKSYTTEGGASPAAFIVRMFRGGGSLPFGRPKFLSDQVFNKSLFGNLYARVDGSTVALTPAEAASRFVVGNPELTYLSETGDQSSSIVRIPVADDKMKQLREVGKLRFDTVFIRNLVFIVNAWRVMRLKLNIELTQYRNVLVESHGLVNPGITEFGAIDPSNNPTGNPAYMETSTTRRYGVTGV